MGHSEKRAYYERVFKKIAFDVPFNDEIVNQMQSAYFWHCILNEILEKSTSIEKIAEQVVTSAAFIQKIVEVERCQLEMPLLVGGKLLELHEKVRPDLQRMDVSGKRGYLTPDQLIYPGSAKGMAEGLIAEHGFTVTSEFSTLNWPHFSNLFWPHLSRD